MTIRFSAAALDFDPAAETDRIAGMIRESLRKDLRRRGLVLGLSGGIDSSVCAGLAVRALGPGHVFALLMPEADSDPESRRLGTSVADTFGIEHTVEDMAPMLAAMGCYERRDAFIRQVEPDYGAGWASKIVFDNGLTTGGYNLSSLVVRSPDGEEKKLRLPVETYLGIVAATNMKQRTRKQLEYYHADRLNYAVLGTPNRLEYDQGFFVKNGDGAADIKPIAHLYKTQVYKLAEYLAFLPKSARGRQRRTPIRCRRRRKSSTSCCLTTRWIFAFTHWTMPCRPPRLPRPLVSPSIRSSLSGRTLPPSARQHAICT